MTTRDLSESYRMTTTTWNRKEQGWRKGSSIRPWCTSPLILPRDSKGSPQTKFKKLTCMCCGSKLVRLRIWPSITRSRQKMSSSRSMWIRSNMEVLIFSTKRSKSWNRRWREQTVSQLLQARKIHKSSSMILSKEITSCEIWLKICSSKEYQHTMDLSMVALQEAWVCQCTSKGTLDHHSLIRPLITNIPRAIRTSSNQTCQLLMLRVKMAWEILRSMSRHASNCSSSRVTRLSEGKKKIARHSKLRLKVFTQESENTSSPKISFIRIM